MQGKLIYLFDTYLTDVIKLLMVLQIFNSPVFSGDGSKNGLISHLLAISFWYYFFRAVSMQFLLYQKIIEKCATLFFKSCFNIQFKTKYSFIQRFLKVRCSFRIHQTTVVEDEKLHLKMATMLEEWTIEEQRSVYNFVKRISDGRPTVVDGEGFLVDC